MNIDFRPLIIAWAILAAAVLVLALWRRKFAEGEDASLHVMDTGTALHQTQFAHKLAVVDRWGKILTAVALISGLALGALYTYQSYVQASTLPSGL